MWMSWLHLWDCYGKAELIRVGEELTLPFNGSSEFHINYNLIHIQPHTQLY